jgi:hypothetical protein
LNFEIRRIDDRIIGELVVGSDTASTGVVVLSGSSGRVDIGRAKLCAEAGAKALALQWFGGEGQPPGICEIPLETFVHATDYLLSEGCQRIVFVGTSKGAEAALLAATLDSRISVVVAISPTSVVWEISDRERTASPGPNGRPGPLKAPLSISFLQIPHGRTNTEMAWFLTGAYFCIA